MSGKDTPILPDEVVELVPTRSLHRKLVEIMAAIDWIKKGGRNDVQRYDYTRQADVVDAVRTELVKRQVTCVPQTIEIAESRDYESKSGGRQHFLLIRVDWVFTDAESGETLVVPSLGAGTDSGDKAPYKAMTGASKYAELLSFLIPTGDDPEKPEKGTDRASTNGRVPAAAAKPAMAAPPAPGVLDGGVVGTADIGKGDADFELRMTPDGHAIGFRLVSGATQLKVIAYSPLAEMLADRKKDVIGTRSTAWGSIEMESWDKVENGKTKTITYPVLTLTRIKGPTFDLAMPEAPEFSPDEQAAVDAALAAAPVTA